MPKTTTPLHQLVKRRVELVRDQVGAQQWATTTPVTVRMGPLSKTFISQQEAARKSLKPIKPGTIFGPVHPPHERAPFYARENFPWFQRWFQIRIPAAKPREKGLRHLYWLANGETTLYIDGKPWGGLDTAHKTCLLPDKACTLWLDCGLWQTGIQWGPGGVPITGDGFKFVGASLRVRAEIAWQTRLDLDLFCDWLDAIYDEEGVPKQGVANHEKPAIGKCKPVFRRMLKQLDDAMDEYDRHGIEKLSTTIKKIYRTFKAEPHNLKVSYVGHAHIDLVWLWPERATYHKSIHTFSTMVQLLKRYPDFIFSMSQPPLLNHVKKQEPALYREVMALIKSRQWEATGSLEVESDTHMPVGEGLARALVYGQERFKEMRGSYSNTAWIPDVFGYSQCLPQVFSLGGVDHFYTQKMSWSGITRFPHNSFVWKGPDGSAILTHLSNTGYNSEIRIAETLHAELEYRQSDVHDEVLIGAGYGDGGGGATEEHIERARRMKDLARIPRVSFSTVENFFKRLGKVRDDLPVYRGELYLEYHRGTTTTQSDFKYFFRRCERGLQDREAVHVLQGKGPLHRDEWLRYIFAQFHDAIPGSSIRDVYAEFIPELKTLAAHHHREARSTWRTGKSKKTTLINTLMLSRTALVELPAPTGNDMLLVDDQGTTLPYQLTGRGKNRKAIALVGLEGLESRTVEYKSDRPEKIDEEMKVTATPTRLRNGIVDATFTANGQLSKLSIGGRDMQLTGTAGFFLHIDNPAEYDAWDIDHSANWLGTRAADRTPLKVIEKGPVRAILRGESGLGAHSKLVVDYVLEINSLFIRIDARIDWQEEHQLLRYTVPTGFKGMHARFGSAFGSIDRTQHAGDQSDEAQWETPGSRWMSVLNGSGEGLSIITEAKYGFRCKEGVASVSLLRSPIYPDPEADRGPHTIRFALGAHELFTDEFDHSTAAAAESLYAPFLTIKGGGVREIPFKLSGLDSVVPSWVLPSGGTKNAYIIRMHETALSDAMVSIGFAKAPKKVTLVDFLERKIGTVKKRSPKSFDVSFKPGQIVSLKVER